MYSNTSRNDFIDTFIAMGRADIGDGNGGNFTIDALHALFDYLEDLEESIGEQIEFDPIGLCCQFGEYKSACLAVGDIDNDACREIMSNNNEESAEDAEALEWLRDRTTVIEFDGGIIIDSEF